MSDEVDILSQLDNIDLSTVQTGFPLLKTGIVSMTITGFEDDRADNGTQILKVKLALAQPWQDVDSKTVNQGFPMTDFIRFNEWVDPKTNEKKNFGLLRVAELRAAVMGKAKPGDRFNREQLINQVVQVSLKYDPAPTNKTTKEVYGPQTTIARYITKK